MTHEMNIDVLKNFIFKIAEQAYITNDTFNSVKAGTVQEHISNKYKVLLNNSTVPIEATLFYSNEKINKNDYVYLIEAFDNANPNFINYYIFGKVGDVQEEIGKSDWSRFVAAEGEGGSKSLANIEWGTIRNTSQEYDKDNNENFINSINNNGYFAIYGDFTCNSDDLKEYGLNITLTFENGEVFVYKFSSQDFIGQPFKISSSLTQKKIFKIQKNITKLSIQGFDIKNNGNINTSDKIGLSNLTIVAGSLYLLDPSIEVEVAAAADSRSYFSKSADNEEVTLHAEITQNGQSIFSDLINYIWYINDPDKQETDEDYWKCLHKQENITLTDIEGHSITIPSIGSKASNLILYRGDQPTVSESESEDNYLYDFGTNNTAEDERDKIKHFNRKIKCEITYEGVSIESNVYDLWDYVNETYSLRIDSNMQPTTFYPGDGIEKPIELTAVKLGGPEKNGPKHEFTFKWSLVEGTIYKVEKQDDESGKEVAISKEDFSSSEKTLTLLLSQGNTYSKESSFIDKFVIKDNIELQCDLYVDDDLNNSIARATKVVNVNSQGVPVVETHYQYYNYSNASNGKINVTTVRQLISNAKYKYNIFQSHPNLVNNLNIHVYIDRVCIVYKDETQKLVLGNTALCEVKREINAAGTKYKTYYIEGSVPYEDDGKEIYYVEMQYTVTGDAKSSETQQDTAQHSKWGEVTFEKAFRTNGEVVDPVWYGEWKIIDGNKLDADWKDDPRLAHVKRDCLNDSITTDTTEFSYSYEYKEGLINDDALRYLESLPTVKQEAIYYTNRRVWIEEQADGTKTVVRQEEWSYPQILKATKGDGQELVQEAVDKLNVFNSLTSGGRDQGMFFEDVYILTKDEEWKDNKKYYKKIYNELKEGSNKFDYQDAAKDESTTPKALMLYELKEDQVYINAEYIQSGALRVGDSDGHILYADIDQQEVEIGGFTVDKDTLKTNDYSVVDIEEEEEEWFRISTENIVFTPTDDTTDFDGAGTYKITATIELLYEKIKNISLPSDIKSAIRGGALKNAEGKTVLNFSLDKKTPLEIVDFDENSKTVNLIIYGSTTPLTSKIGTKFTAEVLLIVTTVVTTEINGFAFSSNQNDNMINSKYFKVDHDGKIKAEDADISGTIRAKALYIGETPGEEKEFDDILDDAVEANTFFAVKPEDGANPGHIYLKSTNTNPGYENPGMIFFDTDQLVVNSPFFKLNHDGTSYKKDFFEVASSNTNLVKNGYGELGNETGFPGFDYQPVTREEIKNNNFSTDVKGYFVQEKNNEEWRDRLIGDLIPVDVTKGYNGFYNIFLYGSSLQTFETPKWNGVWLTPFNWEFYSLDRDPPGTYRYKQKIAISADDEWIETIDSISASWDEDFEIAEEDSPVKATELNQNYHKAKLVADGYSYEITDNHTAIITCFVKIAFQKSNSNAMDWPSGQDYLPSLCKEYNFVLCDAKMYGYKYGSGQVQNDDLYGAIYSYDKDEKLINSLNCNYVKNTLDSFPEMEITFGKQSDFYIPNITKFNIDACTEGKALSYNHCNYFIFWNYTDESGNTYPEHTYSRHLIKFDYLCEETNTSYSSIGKFPKDTMKYESVEMDDGSTVNALTFKNSFEVSQTINGTKVTKNYNLYITPLYDWDSLTSITIAPGTRFSQGYDTQTHKTFGFYGNASTVPIVRWQTMSSYWEGIDYSGENKQQYFFPGTKYIRPVFFSVSMKSPKFYVANMEIKFLSLESSFQVTPSYISLKSKDLIINSSTFSMNWSPETNRYEQGFLSIDTNAFKLTSDGELTISSGANIGGFKLDAAGSRLSGSNFTIFQNGFAFYNEQNSSMNNPLVKMYIQDNNVKLLAMSDYNLRIGSNIGANFYFDAKSAKPTSVTTTYYVDTIRAEAKPWNRLIVKLGRTGGTALPQKTLSVTFNWNFGALGGTDHEQMDEFTFQEGNEYTDEYEIKPTSYWHKILNGVSYLAADGKWYSYGSVNIPIHKETALSNETPQCISHGSIIPETNSKYVLGTTGAAWAACVVEESTAKTMTVEVPSQTGSDIKKKMNITSLGEKYNLFFDNLVSKTYQYKENTSNRYHCGFIAQEVLEALNQSDLSTQEFAGICISDLNDLENADYTIRYEEFIALNTDQIQKLKKRESELENKVALLEQEIKEIKGEI